MSFRNRVSLERGLPQLVCPIGPGSTANINAGCDLYAVANTAGAPVTLTLTDTPVDGDTIEVWDVLGNAATHNINLNIGPNAIIGGQTFLIATLPTVASIVTNFFGLRVVYSLVQNAWLVDCLGCGAPG
jgi:hypothetical protein